MATKYTYYVRVEDDVLLRAPTSGPSGKLRFEVLHKHGWTPYAPPDDIFDRITKVTEPVAALAAKNIGAALGSG